LQASPCLEKENPFRVTPAVALHKLTIYRPNALRRLECFEIGVLLGDMPAAMGMAGKSGFARFSSRHALPIIPVVRILLKVVQIIFALAFTAFVVAHLAEFYRDKPAWSQMGVNYWIVKGSAVLLGTAAAVSLFQRAARKAE
jgi:hypothetical protein